MHKLGQYTSFWNTKQYDISDWMGMESYSIKEKSAVKVGEP